ncbi:hypothetical protein SMICM17S_04561 [Streptomyces microflavus]
MSPLVAAGESSASPAAAIRIALSSSSGSAPLPRNPEAPARRAWTTYSSTSKVVSMTTRTAASAGSALIMRVAASPSGAGIRMSISTTSAPVARASSTAWAPSATLLHDLHVGFGVHQYPERAAQQRRRRRAPRRAGRGASADLVDPGRSPVTAAGLGRFRFTRAGLDGQDRMDRNPLRSEVPP